MTTRRDILKGITAGAGSMLFAPALSRLEAQLTPAAALPEMIGYRGDGAGVFPDCTPVLQWSEAKNVVWKTPLPNLGQGSPICVAGKVLVMCEPGWKSDAPLLVCVDAASGKVLWQREVDPFDLLPDDEQAEAKRLRARFFELWRLGYNLAFRARGASPDELKAIFAAADEQGIPYKNEGKHLEIAHNAFWHGKTPPYKELEKRFDFRMPIWHHGCEGMTFPTPASDGKFLYVVTAYKVVACYDLDGEQQWMRWHRDEPYTRFIHIGEGKEHGMHFSASFVPSPVLVGDTLVVNGNTKLRGYDKTTGETRWEHQLRQVNYMVGTPIHLRLPTADGEAADVVFTASGEVVRVSDGKILAANIGQFGNGSGPIAIGPDVIFGMNGQSGGHYKLQEGRRFTDRGGVAIRLVWDGGDSVEPELLWHSRRDADTGEITPVYHDGLLYVDRFPRAIDALTGETVAKPRVGKGQEHDTKHAHTIAGGHVFTINKDGKSAVFRAGHELGEAVALNSLDQMPLLAGEKREQVIAQTGQLEPADWYGWNFSPALPFFSGNRVFIRSHDFLYCLGDPDAPLQVSTA